MSEYYEKAVRVLDEVEKAVKGKRECITKVFAAILAGGHILLEDVPGVGKTTLAVSFSKAVSLECNRVQFTPDVMPADILGFNMYSKETQDFQYHAGAVMCNLFLADEINRTSPKTQSALLEVMEEGAVTIDTDRYNVPDPFIVIATQNPKGSAGTQLLPESQLDRFMVCLSMGYPGIKNEIEIAKSRGIRQQTAEQVDVVLEGDELNRIKDKIDNVYMNDNMYTYIVKLIEATRENSHIELGVSPRGTLALTGMTKAWAFLKGREYAIPQDVVDVFADVAKHRIVLSTRARAAGVKAETVLEEILNTVKKPVSYKTEKKGIL